MKCPLKNIECNKYKNYTLTEIKNGNVESYKICEDCFSCMDDFNKNKEENQKKEEKKSFVDYALVCPNCKLTLEDLMKKSRLGCAKCYEVFDGQLNMGIDKIQKNMTKKKLQHIGKVPKDYIENQMKDVDPESFLLELKKEQKISIEIENYELANELKGKIIGFEFLLSQYKIFKSEPEQSKLLKDQINEFIFLHKMKLKE